MTNDLTKQHCVPCEGGVAPLAGKDLELLLKSLKDWKLDEEIPRQAPSEKFQGKQSQHAQKILKEFKFKNFAEAIKFVNRVADIAESEGHHPDIFISYNLVRLELATHAINGLSQNDFILAAKIDEGNSKLKNQISK